MKPHSCDIYQPYIGQPIVSLVLLEKDASARSYARIKDTNGQGYIGVFDPNCEQLSRFLKIANLLREYKMRAPKVLNLISKNQAILEDFGELAFSQCLLNKKVSSQKLYESAVTCLQHIHTNIKYKPEIIPLFTASIALEHVIRFLSFSGVAANQEAINCFKEIWIRLFSVAFEAPFGLALVDFHVDNLVYLPGHAGINACGLLDFQDAMWAPVAFDLVSLLQDARQDVPDSVYTDSWFSFLNMFPNHQHSIIRESGYILSLSRHLRIIELFNRLAMGGQKKYLKHTTRLWNYVDICLNAYPERFKELSLWIDTHVTRK